MTPTEALPLIIQGGMGIGVSNWILARSVSMEGHLGVVSGTCMDSLMVRRLQDGDIGGHIRRALDGFPSPDIAGSVVRKYFRPEGKAPDEPYALLSMYRQVVNKAREQVTILSNFVEVQLAKEGHDGVVGINLLTKVQMPNLASLYGAMVAGVDYVLMGAGIPKDIPGVLDAFAEGKPASIKMEVEGGDGSEELTFDPRDHWDGEPPKLKRPRFLPIISADSLARMLLKKANGKVDGFVIEGPTAGGHNAPPRGKPDFNERGEPVYGERDVCDLERMRELGLPFWLAGGSGSPEKLVEALEAGAAGVQVGTLFAYSDEAGIERSYKDHVLRQAAVGKEVDVYTDARASPTGFPFKVVQLEGSNASTKQYLARQRVCDLGYLRKAYKREDGRIDYRCPAEPVDTYVKKGGRKEDTAGRKCLCNALMADIGHAQVQRNGDVERPILTSGDDLKNLSVFLQGRARYSARDVLDYLLAGVRARRNGRHAADVPAPPTQLPRRTAAAH
jgi:NAD(P)H-dependent flavin oxidoreductase YrpB (nitropropane dioxygenase family)